MSRSDSLYASALQVIPGGVNSPVRAFNGVGGTPPFIKKAKGAYVYDVDDKAYVDYVGSWGPMILGHGDDEVLAAISAQLQQGVSFGAPTEIEITMAQLICKLLPSIDMVRMVNSGTEATMSAIRLARGFTGRDKILKFEGCYHGHSDGLLVKAGSGALTMGVPSSPGVPASVTEHTLTAQFNDLASVEQAFAQQGENIAAIIVEPVAGNMNCIPPSTGFLQGLRDICDQYQSVLIFDEVMCGFRVHLQGAQTLYGVTPDLTTLGKVIGGGLPVGAFGGKQEIMQQLAPAGGVYQAGTLSGNPIAMTAGLVTLQKISQPGVYEQLQNTASKLLQGLGDLAQNHKVGFSSNQVGSMFGLFFTEQERVGNFAQVNLCDVDKFKQFFHSMLAQGIYLAPSAFEAGFVSVCHQQTELEKTLAAADRAFAQLA